MNAAARVEIGGFNAEPGTVGVAGDQDVPCLLRIVGEALFHFIFVSVVLGRAGGVQHAEMFQGLPEIPHQKTGQAPEGGVQRVGLVAMGQVETLSLSALSLPALLENKSLVESKSRKEGLVALGIRREKGIADLVGITRSLFLHVVIPIQQIEPSLPVKQGEEPEHIVVDLDDLAHAPVLPQFVPVPQFDIGVALGVIMLQGRKIQVLIFQKIVAPGAVAPMTVADEHIAAAGAQRQYGGLLKSTGEAG